jgi:hypothetical protein
LHHARELECDHDEEEEEDDAEEEEEEEEYDLRGALDLEIGFSFSAE